MASHVLNASEKMILGATHVNIQITIHLYPGDWKLFRYTNNEIQGFGIKILFLSVLINKWTEAKFTNEEIAESMKQMKEDERNSGS